MEENLQSIHSHLSVLEGLVGRVPIKAVIEFGMGEGSTRFFLDHCEWVMSIEMQSKEWFDRCKKNYSEYKSWNPVLALGPSSYDVKTFPDKVDLVFVDGHGQSRVEQITDNFCRTSVIVAHDTQQPAYGWRRLQLPEGWVRIDHKEERAWTSILTCDERLKGWKRNS